MDPNANVLHEDDVDLESAGEDDDRIRVIRPVALGPGILALEHVTLAGDVKRIGGETWFVIDRDATWSHT